MLGHIHEHHYVSPSPKAGKVALTMQTSVFKLLLQTEFQLISKHVIKEASDHWILSTFQRYQFILSETVCGNTLQQFYSYFGEN